MAKARSPSYPTIGLREAVEKIKLVYVKDYQNKISRQIVAEHMGYHSLNGKSLGVLSAVSKYGLLEGRGEDNRVSDLALEIIAHSPGTPERARALREAASRPELFADIDTKFHGGKASDSAIRSYLITQKFIPQAADTAIRAYRETKALVSEEAGDYTQGVDDPVVAEEAEMSLASPESAPGKRLGQAPAPLSAMQPGEREYLRGPLSRETGYRLLVSGEIGARELGKIIKILSLQRELLADDDEEPGEPAQQ